MEFSITLARSGGVAPTTTASLRIGEGGCTIGRNPDNDLPLADPERVISGLHARLEVVDGALWVTDLSTNGTFLNQAAERLPIRLAVRLTDGDTLTIGHYELVIAASERTTGFGHLEPIDLLGDEALPGLQSTGVTPDILDILAPGTTPPTSPRTGPAVTNQFADAMALDAFLSGPATPADAALAIAPPTPFEHVHFRPPEIGAVTGAAIGAIGESAPPGAPLLPDDYDLLADTFGNDTVENAAAFGALAPIAAPVSAPPACADWSPAEPSVFPEVTPGTLSSPVADRQPAEPAAVLSEPPAAPRSALQPAPPATAPEPTPMPLPIPQAMPQAVRESVPIATPATVSGPAPAIPDPRLAAFLAGLGAGRSETITDPNRLLEDAGRLLRALTQGLTTTMQARAEFKSELRLAVTTIRAKENNPFKFSVGVDETLERLLFRPGPGFLPPVEAACSAFDDIQAHEMAMIAGLRAALRALLARFDPAELERRLGAASGLDKLLPMARRSRYWDLFTEIYDQVAADASEDFMQLFGDAFTRAYEDQIQRLVQARRQPPPTPGRSR
jgi:type VI secretion system FHA domain protein